MIKSGLVWTLWLWFGGIPILAQQSVSDGAALHIPFLDAPPKFEDFLDMRPAGAPARRMAVIDDFTQREPKDGAKASERTIAYLGYDRDNLYVVFVCFDSDVGGIRANMVRRDVIGSIDNDYVDIRIDTFSDQRRSYYLGVNPLGVQMDSLWPEGVGDFSMSFDMVWHTRGRITDRGYVVWSAIPFKSLRFPTGPRQNWRFFVGRWIRRKNEWHFWPPISQTRQSWLAQMATLEGLRDVSPGRNMHFIPYGSFRSLRALDERDPSGPRFRRDRAEVDAGLDSKIVLGDSTVLDLTFNPDFSQVESDQPQVTTNQRFEVFFPELRPFFQENSDFFGTPLNLLFTRRIADPSLGARLTGKVGKYAFGALLIDDEAPGKSVPQGDPLQGASAKIGVFRLARDILSQSSMGFIYTDHQLARGSNRLGGVDFQLQLHSNWKAVLQAVSSSTRQPDGTTLDGPAYLASIQRSGRTYNYRAEYQDIGRDFRTRLGFIPRTDIRSLSQSGGVTWRPESTVLSWGPSLESEQVWDHSGTRLDNRLTARLNFSMQQATEFGFFARRFDERLRPGDFPILPGNQDFRQDTWGFEFNSSFSRVLTVGGSFSRGDGINFAPPQGQTPFLADATSVRLEARLWPVNRLRNENTVLLTRLTERAAGGLVFNNHIFRSRWSWQFNRELSLRFIAQYDSTLPNQARSALERRKNINADVLLTYQVNPWTALFLGYNTNGQNIDLLPAEEGTRLVRTGSRLINDGRQLFVKFSYLFSF